jgi:uncharacterized protein (TIGR02600 family)
MKTLLPHAFKTSRQGMALVMVITALALMSILMVAIFTTTQNEYKSTQSYVNARAAKDLADVGVAIVEAQIQNGQFTGSGSSSRTFHATQPGMVRVYNADGSFNAAYKLYSSSQMKLTGSSETAALAKAYVPTDWASNPKNLARFVDLNEPVARPNLAATAAGAATGIDLFFPIIDPRAAWNYAGSQTPAKGATTTQVEGFSYSSSTPDNTATYAEVRTPDKVTGPNDLRLPMPVEWLYILQDGSTGTLDASNNWVPDAAGTIPTADNPMVGRVAFWTDDECCKVNINTASEPTFFQSPFYYSKRDYMWANCPPLIGEYQRYPGHPATVALSAVLAPGVRLDPLNPSLDSGFSSATDVVNFKKYIYEIAPKITSGGSESGTLTFGTDDYANPYSEMGNSLAKYIDIKTVKSERLFASVDELLFKDSNFTGGATGAAQKAGTGRQPTYNPNLPGGRKLFSHDALEHARFFLTAQSRAPEFTMYGLPRIAVWPLPDETLGPKSRTIFDQTIALCSTLRGTSAGASVANSYIFRRKWAHSQDKDLGINGENGLQRNSYLLSYLVAQMSNLTWPQTSNNGSSPNFERKYGRRNVNQLAVQFFDYIRSTNLYDGILARNNNGTRGAGLNGVPNSNGDSLYTVADQLGNPGTDFFTFTNPSITPSTNDVDRTSVTYDSSTKRNNSADADVLPGHGVVTPIVWSNSGTNFRGFGRFLTLSEIGYMCICTADGYADPNGVHSKTLGMLSGGGTAPRLDPTAPGGGNHTNRDIFPKLCKPPVGQGLLDPNATARWYSNFPPLTGTYTEKTYGTRASLGPAATNPDHPANHPGFDPANWNLSLPLDTPLQSDEKRVQVMLMMEAFCPMLGWTKMFPEYAIVLDGNYIAGITLNGTRLFDTTQDVVIKSNGNAFEFNSGGTLPFGGHAGPSAMTGGGGGRPVSGNGPVTMPSDPAWVTGNTSGHNGVTNYGLNSNFITVKRNGSLKISFPGQPLVIKIYDKHDFTNLGLQPVQIINVTIPSDNNLPVPALVYNDCPPPAYATQPPASNPSYVVTTDGYGRVNQYRSCQAPHWWCFNQAGCVHRLKGTVNPLYPKGAFWLVAPTPTPYVGDAVTQTCHGRLDTSPNAYVIQTLGTWHGPGLSPPENVNSTTLWRGSDVVRTMVPAAGDYRLMAALYNVPASMWQQHPVWTAIPSEMLSHSWTNAYAGSETGCKLPPEYPTNQRTQLVNGITFGKNATSDITWTPDLPPSPEAASDANRYGDFDTGIAGSRCGPYVNKPDEGNFFIGMYNINNSQKNYRSGYFYDPWNSSDDWRSGVYMSPNRMISSPVMFGSLPTGVWQEGTASQSPSSGIPAYPWQTLLFRPYSQSNSSGGVSVSTGHPGDANPRDHFLLDMFCMPVVEPYAISEPLSMAGRINLNFQIMPFTNIRRATALHALMKGEYITAIPNESAWRSKNFNTQSGNGPPGVNFWDEKNTSEYWHRPINVKETLVQFDEKFNGTASGVNHNITQVRGLFRSASQICEMHLIPDTNGSQWSNGSADASLTGLNSGNRQSAMDNFWQANTVTGDNVRERPYSNLYNRITTRSNTFRVHVRAQTIKKARSTLPNTYDTTKDTVLSEYRGSVLIERYIDPNARKNPLDPNDRTTAIPDYAQTGNPLSLPSLESFYRFRALETKRFNP